MPEHISIVGVKDSKKLSAAQRDRIFADLVAHSEVAYSVYAPRSRQLHASLSLTNAAGSGPPVKGGWEVIESHSLIF